jgi:hypothetical protein
MVSVFLVPHSGQVSVDWRMIRVVEVLISGPRSKT